MIKIEITNTILNRILKINEKKILVDLKEVGGGNFKKIEENIKVKKTYYSNKIDNNLLTEKQVTEVINDGNDKELLKTEKEVMNYYKGLDFLDKCVKERRIFSKELIVGVHNIINNEMINDVLYNDEQIFDELIDYVNNSGDNALIIAGVVHYQLIALQPFKYTSGKIARLLSDYILASKGYGFKNMGCLDEYFAYDREEYFKYLSSLDVWIDYYLHIMELYATKVHEMIDNISDGDLSQILANLNVKERDLLVFLIKKHQYEFTPIDVSKMLNVTNKTIINRCSKLIDNGFIIPMVVNKRIRCYKLSDYTIKNEDRILEQI